jgi:hypothetical protein
MQLFIVSFSASRLNGLCFFLPPFLSFSFLDFLLVVGEAELEKNEPEATGVELLLD